MRCLRSIMAFMIFALPVCISAASYRIEISPKTENHLFEMRLQDTATFSVTGYGKEDESAEEAVVSIDKVWWSFDKQVLAKVNSDGNSITLRAIRAGTSELKASAVIKNSSCAESITILVK